jgi:hypothetical protein
MNWNQQDFDLVAPFSVQECQQRIQALELRRKARWLIDPRVVTFQEDNRFHIKWTSGRNLFVTADGMLFPIDEHQTQVAGRVESPILIWIFVAGWTVIWFSFQLLFLAVGEDPLYSCFAISLGMLVPIILLRTLITKQHQLYDLLQEAFGAAP